MEITKDEYRQLVLDQERLVRLFGYIAETVQEGAEHDAEREALHRDFLMVNIKDIDLITGWKLCELYENTYNK